MTGLRLRHGDPGQAAPPVPTPPDPSTGLGHLSARLPPAPAHRHVYPVVQHHLEAFLAQAAETDPMGYGVPSWVERDFRAYPVAASWPMVLLEHAVRTAAMSA